MKEARFAMLARSKPKESERLLALAQEDIAARWAMYEQLAGATREVASSGNGGDGTKKAASSEEVKA